MKRFVFGTLGTLLTLHIVTWILSRNSLSLIDPYADGYYTSNCTWYSWPDGHLNLSQFYNRNITGKIYNYYNHSQTLFFTYTPCANTIRCPGSNGSMITISNNYTNSFCVPIAFWEYGTNDPTHHIYGPNGNEYYWEFIYNQSNYTHINESVHINWYCDPTVRGYRTNGSYYRRNEYNGNMMFDFDISSSVACNSTNFTNITTTTTTTTTQIPGGKCLWNMGGHILNLTAFRNQTLATIDSKNSSIVVAMTPCDNLLICDDGNFVEAVMAYREEFMHNTCVDYLAIWDEGLNEPRYDVSSRTWQFVYENGQKCGGFERVFQVFWKCDYQTRNTAKIVTFEQTGSCSFEMHINSSYACS
eukprot:314681_1